MRARDSTSSPCCAKASTIAPLPVLPRKQGSSFPHFRPTRSNERACTGWSSGSPRRRRYERGVQRSVWRKFFSAQPLASFDAILKARRNQPCDTCEVIALFGILLLASTLPSNVPASMFRGDASHSGIYDSPAPSLAAVKWRFRANGRLFSSPTVADSVVYIGSTDGKLYAVRASDGSQAWAFTTKGPVNSTPAVWNGLVFFSSVDGNVYALDARSGAQRWIFKTDGERRFVAPGIHGIIPQTELMPDPYDLLLSSPAVEDGEVYIGSGDHNVYALDARTGRLRWKFTTGNVVHASPAVSNGVVYIGSWDRYFYAIDAQSGMVRWKFLTGDDTTIYNQVGIAGSATIANGTVYFGCRDSHLYALDAATGALRWVHDDHGSWVIGTPAVVGNSVAFTTSDEKKFYVLDAATGKDGYSVPYGMFAFSSPSIASGTAFF